MWLEIEVGVLVFLLAQEEVGGHPDGWLGVGAVGFLLAVPEILTTG